jgi:class 3 adenylate cyclase
VRSGSTALATESVVRRLAAILAADVAGYSRLPNDGRSLCRPANWWIGRRAPMGWISKTSTCRSGSFGAVCRRKPNRHEGLIARYLGNNALVLFGYPEAQEHDAERENRE